MSGFVYYLPGLTAVNRVDLERVGLWDRLPRFAFRAPVSGPDGGNGAMVATCSAACRYQESEQEWRDAGGYWVGWTPGTAPGPADLERGQLVGGHWVRLSDGRDWLVPVARAFPAGTALPERLILGPTGEVVTERLPEYAALYAGAERAWGLFVAQASPEDAEDDGEPWTLIEQMDLAATALGVNYRVTRLEVAALGLLTTRNVGEVCAALIDLPTILDAAKKNERTGDASSSDGAPG